VPIVIAHRGASAFAPEHTIAAYDLALDIGADYIEHDLQLTADAELVVLHDDTLDRTTRGACTGRVAERTYAEIADCDAGSWFNRVHPHRARPEYAKLRIPRLKDVFARYAGRARFYIETKNPADAPGMEEKLVTLLEAHGLAPQGGTTPSLREPSILPTVILQSFNTESLNLLRDLAPAIPRVQLIESGLASPDIIEQLDDIAQYAQAVGPAHTSVDPALLAAAHARTLAVHPYTINEETTMRSLTNAGVDAMFTDDPTMLLSIRSQKLAETPRPTRS
jgi:glycerophosphoryl diester phosphodiesterase